MSNATFDPACFPVLFIPFQEATIEMQHCIGWDGKVTVGKPQPRAATIALRLDFQKDLGDGFWLYRASETGDLVKVRITDVRKA